MADQRRQVTFSDRVRSWTALSPAEKPHCRLGVVVVMSILGLGDIALILLASSFGLCLAWERRRG
jgi:hypothetical protein